MTAPHNAWFKEETTDIYRVNNWKEAYETIIKIADEILLTKGAKKMITLYTIGCPQCDILKAKLDKKNIKYSVVSDRETLKNMGLTTFPILEIDGKRLEFVEANNWVNAQGEQCGN